MRKLDNQRFEKLVDAHITGTKKSLQCSAVSHRQDVQQLCAREASSRCTKRYKTAHLKSEKILTNILLGILGAFVANLLLVVVGITAEGAWLAQLVVGLLGACLLIWIWRAFKK